MGLWSGIKKLPLDMGKVKLFNVPRQLVAKLYMVINLCGVQMPKYFIIVNFCIFKNCSQG